MPPCDYVATLLDPPPRTVPHFGLRSVLEWFVVRPCGDGHTMLACIAGERHSAPRADSVLPESLGACLGVLVASHQGRTGRQLGGGREKGWIVRKALLTRGGVGRSGLMRL